MEFGLYGDDDNDDDDDADDRNGVGDWLLVVYN